MGGEGGGGQGKEEEEENKLAAGNIPLSSTNQSSFPRAHLNFLSMNGLPTHQGKFQIPTSCVICAQEENMLTMLMPSLCHPWERLRRGIPASFSGSCAVCGCESGSPGWHLRSESQDFPSQPPAP